MKRLWVATLWLALLGGRSAFAQGDSAAAAEALFDQGRAAMEKRDYETACQRFRESERVDPAPGTKLNLADCEEKRGRIASAWELFRAALRDLPESDERHAIAATRAAALEPRLPMLTLRLAAGAPASTQVRLGTAEIGSGSFGVPLPLDPGRYTLIVAAPGHASKSIEIVLAERAQQTLDLAPGAANPSPTPAVTPIVKSDAPAHSDRTLGYVFGGVGVVGLAVGAVTGAMVLSKKSIAEEQCPNAQNCNQRGADANDAGRVLGPITTVALVVGAAGLGAGAYFILSEKNSSETALQVRAGPDAAHVALFRRF